jgi:hypothetical protein
MSYIALVESKKDYSEGIQEVMPIKEKKYSNV